MYLQIDVADERGWAMVFVPQRGAAKVLFDTTDRHGDDTDYLAGTHLLDAPTVVKDRASVASVR